MALARFFTAAALSALLLSGCKKNSSDADANSNKIRVGYIGLTCEAPIFTAVEKGFFKEEGLDVEPGEVRMGQLQGCARARRVRHHASSRDVFSQADRTGTRCEIHRRNPSRMSARPGCGERQYPHDPGSARETDWRSGNGHAAIYFCQSSPGRERH